VNNYREAYNLYVCTGILFNHESPLRPVRFVTQKIISTAKRIAAGSGETLTLGRMDISRDWGWAPEYVDAMWRMLQLDKPEDFVIATGVTLSLEDFVAHTFNMLGLYWKDHVIQSQELFRPTDILVSCADVSKAKKKLNWGARIKGVEVIEAILKSDAVGSNT
jgi:GDPmannose 4,6-dehydratase